MKSKILVAGDSIAKGILYDLERRKYAHSHKGFCDLIAPYLSGPIKNTARFGNTIRTGLTGSGAISPVSGPISR